MENKYYTPDISEFYVGFEFEHKDDNYDGREEFQKTIIESDNLLRYPNEVSEYNYYEYEHLLSNIKYDIEHGDIRVKYLDKEDIESLGFKLYKQHLEIGYDEAYQVYSNPIKTGCTINVKWGTSFMEIWYGSFNSYAGRIVFRGVIKNKSELNQILKMIGYDNNNR